MTNTICRALVVEDQAMIRNLTMRALRNEGFDCDSAVDGIEALELCEQTNYGVVITDLRMPKKNGHALAVDLLANEEYRPLIVILTGVAEPALAKDLLNRGVSDIIYKPVDYALLAAKVRTLTDRTATCSTMEPAHAEATQTASETLACDSPGEVPRVDAATFQQDAQRLEEVVPMSEQFLKVYRMSNSTEFSMENLSEEISKHSFLADEVLGMAKRPFYNPKGVSISSLSRAVMQIGQKRVGQIALAATAQAALTGDETSPLNLSLLWRRSVAAGLAVEILIDQGGHRSIADGLLLCATMQEVGRVALAKLYPKQYEQMIGACESSDRSLHEIEQTVLPVRQANVMSDLLRGWNLPASVFQPLQYLHESDDAIAALPATLRTRVRLVKLAGLVARLAIGSWDRWDEVAIPPRDIASELKLDSIECAIDDTRHNMEGILLPAQGATSFRQRPDQNRRRLAYFDSSFDTFDALHGTVSFMPFDLVRCTSPSSVQEHVLINCAGVQSKAAIAIVESCRNANVCVVCNVSDADFYDKVQHRITLPLSYAALEHAINKVVE